MRQVTNEERETIERIILEASAYGLQREIIELANNYIKDGYSALHAYQSAYEDWIKQ